MNQNLRNFFLFFFFFALSVFFRSISGNTISDMEFTGDSLWLGTDFGLVEMDTSYNFNIYLHDPYNIKQLQIVKFGKYLRIYQEM